MVWENQGRSGVYIYFVQSQVDPCVWYKEEMVPLFYVNYCLIFSPYKDRIDKLYSSLQADFKIEGDRYINKYLEIDLELRPDS